MTRINSQIEEEKVLALRALLWISTSFRPLSVQELRHAVAVHPEDEDFDEEGLIEPNLIVSVCAGLIAIDAESKTIRLVHFTVDEYFRTTKERWFPDAHALIAMTCLTYISFLRQGRNPGLQLWPSPERSFTGTDRRREDLTAYALRHWNEHAFRQESIAFQDHAIKIFQDDENIENFSRYRDVFLNPDDERPCLSHHTFPSDWPPFGVHILAIGGLLGTLRTVFQSRINPDCWQSTAEDLLNYAVLYDRASMVDFLVTSCNADVNARIGFWSKPLYYAVKYDTVASLEVLLSHGADLQNHHKLDFVGDSLVRLAVIRTSAAALKLLLGHGPDPNVLGERRGRSSRGPETPLYTACNQGDLAKVQLLLEHGADPNIICKRGQIALHAAADLDDGARLIEPLLKAGSDMNATDKEGLTPLHLACSEEVKDILLHHGADPSIKDNRGRTFDEC